jgi:hypothetical protein
MGAGERWFFARTGFERAGIPARNRDGTKAGDQRPALARDGLRRLPLNPQAR